MVLFCPFTIFKTVVFKCFFLVILYLSSLGDSFFFFNNLKNLFIFRCAGFLLLHKLFSSCNGHGLLFIALHRFLIAVASFVAKQRLKNTEVQRLWHIGSVVAVPKSARAQAQ